MVESEATDKTVLCFEDKRRWLPNAMSWVTANLTNTDESSAAEGKYYV